MAADLQNQLPVPRPPPSSAEDETLRRNTDCVYFLASPLTCKKGTECEYRHCEYARVNPRDCYYWMNGNCMNPKCSFRHPPLDGLLGSQAATSIGSSIAQSQPAFSTAMPVPSPNLNKQAVPCIFFQKGFCLKADKCAFLHGPSSMNNKLPHAPMALPVTETSPFKRTFVSLAKCTQEQKIPEVNITKPAEGPHEVKTGENTKPAIMKREVLIQKKIPPFEALDAEIPRYNQTAAPVVVNESSISRSSPMLPPCHDDHSFQNGKDADEFIRESSPGFDVIVEDEIDDDYYHNEEQYGRVGVQEGRNCNTMNEFDVAHPANYSSRVEMDRERFRDPHDLDSYDYMQGPYAREHYRTFSERKLVGTAPVERRGYPKGLSPDQIDECDLRHRLSKQRRVNGFRSVVVQDYARDSHIEEQSYKGSRRDSRHLSPHDSSVSSRLRGRIKLPQISLPVNSSEVRSEREAERGMNWGRLSPRKPIQGRLRDRIKGVVMREDTGKEGRNFRGSLIRRDLMDDSNIDFDAPKSLAELKEGKNAENNVQLHSSGGAQRNSKVENCQQLGGDITFEGPKPLSVILKRKREAGGVTSSENSGEYGRKMETKESLGGSYGTSVTETRNSVHSIPASETAEDFVRNDEEKFKSKEGEEVFVHEVMEDQEVDQKEEVYDIDHVDGREYDDMNDGENGEPDEEDDGEDDFAKKIGVVFT